jgi:hypothetical protein
MLMPYQPALIFLGAFQSSAISQPRPLLLELHDLIKYACGKEYYLPHRFASGGEVIFGPEMEEYFRTRRGEGLKPRLEMRNFQGGSQVVRS